MRSLKILDRLTPFQTHRVALFYGGESGGSDSFLKTKYASPDFWQFSKELGDFVPIRHLKYFSGGLDTSASRSDGMYAIVWFGNQGGSDELNFPTLVDSMVIFHTVTLMPNKETNRKRHVGNDVVHIVYGYEPTANSDEAKENAGSSIMQADMICQSLLEDKLGLVLNIEDRSGRIHEMDRHLKSESQR
ncbi:Rap/Ran-GAP superfamily protein [Skeletonema marinoi]|uniref:Rap/Ran-GAP superfamily protein n=1 Tax=Skeletonema marinoi TaxID=267567 RepID=A0AAD9D4L3_9STRA|nr:Rap/Ran-GAP superfamily protein [Skeletonema marinoi]